jgi:hypothetical protein
MYSLAVLEKSRPVLLLQLLLLQDEFDSSRGMVDF